MKTARATIFLLTLLPLYTSAHSHNSVSSSLLAKLGWVNSPFDAGLCKGYYVEPRLTEDNQAILAPQLSKTTINASYGSFSTSGTVTLSGDVVVSQNGRLLKADRAVVVRDPQTGKIKTIDLYGHVEAFDPGRLVLGDQAHMTFPAQSGTITHVTYRLLLKRPPPNLPPRQKAGEGEGPYVSNSSTPFLKTRTDGEQQLSVDNLPQGLAAADDTQDISPPPLLNAAAEREYVGDDKHVRLVGLVAWGRADIAIQHDPQHLQFKNAEYTTCAPNDDQWRLQARDIKINKVSGRGEARDVKLLAGGVPIFHLPYLNFPIDQRRKTGFLFPTLGYTNASGAQFGIPFYWNIAPNYDLTLTPTAYSSRGVLLNGLFRYLTPHSLGLLEGSFMPQDQAFRAFKNSAAQEFPGQPGLPSLLDASNNRYMWHMEDQTQFSEHWSGGFDYTSISDDYYFQDFSELPTLLGATQLLRTAQVQYLDPHWQFTTAVQSYHTLHPVNRQRFGDIYSQLPVIELRGNFPNAMHGLNFGLWTQAVYFSRNLDPNELTPVVTGSRMSAAPGVSLPMRANWGYLTPAAHLQASYYSLQNQLPDLSSNINRVLPVLNIDSGLYFDRSVNLGGSTYQQTLEPRLFYLYVPYKNQDDIPNFDTSYIPFTYDQLFRTNRFAGHDRIADANQASLALTSRMVNQETGEELAHISVGSILYFENRRVKFCRLPDCSDVNTQVGANSETESISPLATQASYFFNSLWSVNGDMAYDFQDGATVTSDLYLQFKPDERRVFNFGYAYLRNGDRANNAPLGSSRNNLSQIIASYAWPISPRWSTLATVGYDINRNYAQTYLFGLQYDTCCWAVRVGAGRSFSVLDQFGNPEFRNVFYIQWQLKGLGSIGTNQFSRYLKDQIPGYTDTFIRNVNQMR